MKPLFTATALAALLALTACDQANNAAGAASAAETSSATQGDTGAIPAETSVKSRDGSFSITLNSGYADKSQDPAYQPEGSKADDILLLQHSDSEGITVTALRLGQSGDAALDGIETALKARDDLQDLSSSKQNGVLSYSFYSDSDGTTVNESCRIQAAGKELVSICAVSPYADATELEDLLKTVSFGS